jgi:hypothetical protein
MLHVVSPIAKLPSHERTSVAKLQDDCTDAKLTETDYDEPGTSLFAAEVHIRFHPDDSDLEEMLDAICRAVGVADRIERTLTDRDRGLESLYHPTLNREEAIHAILAVAREADRMQELITGTDDA